MKSLLLLMVSISVLAIGCRSDGSRYTRQDQKRLEVIQEYADNVLRQGADRWSGQNTPLLADGINVDTGEPVVWRFEGEEFIIHNLASQQNLFRLLAGLTRLTGEEHYKAAAKQAIQYHFDYLVSDCGKLRWGGHQFIDLQTMNPIGHFDSNVHEFKTNFPFYELMWEVDPEATTDFIRALWDGHIVNWDNLIMNRHARYGSGPPPGPDLWDKPFDYPEPFFEAPGLSFLNCGADLIYAAGVFYALKGEQGALDWAKRLADMYTRARHPETGMGTYQYTKPLRREEPPPTGQLLGRLTWGTYGDRTENQFGRSGSSDPSHEFYNPVKDLMGPDGMLMAREGWMVQRGGFPWYAIIQLHLAETLGETGSVFGQDAADHLLAYAQYSYVPEENHFLAMWADGTDATGLKIPRSGYHGEQGRVFEPRSINAHDLMTYTRAYRITGRSELWDVARNMAKGLELGDIGQRPGDPVHLNLNAPGSDYREIFALLELYRTVENPSFLNRARVVADRIIENQYHHGFFLPTEDHIHANFDRLEPLAILSLDATIRGVSDIIPTHVGGSGFIHGRYDGFGRTRDGRAIWAIMR